MDTATAATISKFSVSKAHKAQTYLAKKIISEDRLPEKINLVAGVDVAYAGELAIGAVAVLDYESLEFLDLQTATCRVKFPYIPTLLSFREIPPAVACIRRLKQQPDVFLADGQGVAHPYRCGFASHLGLAIGKPTIGVAKSRLIGKPTEIGRDVFLVENDQIIGSVVTKKEIYRKLNSLTIRKRARWRWKMEISFEDFQKLDLRVGKITEANQVPGSRNLIRMIFA